MRVGLVIYGSLDSVSGGYLYDRKLVEHLRRAGDSVEIIALPWRNYARHLLDNFSANFLHQLCDASFDVLVQDELDHPSLAFLNARVRAATRTPLISIVHHLRCYEAHPAPLNALYRRIERRYLASVDGFICNSATTRNAVAAVLGVAPTRFVIASPAGDRFNPGITHMEIVARTRQSRALRIAFVANVIRRKGLHTLIDALAQLPRDDFVLTIVGNPNVDVSYTRAIRRQSESRRVNARWVGVLVDGALADAFASSDVLVVPSEYEGFGIVYLEAMSFGVPSVATTAGAAREIIADGENGFLVAPNDARTLAARLADLQRDRARLTQMSITARIRFLAQPTWDASMARVRARLIEWTR
ncbi:MAG: glycosyltransferase family 4 protein [Chloroflexi bacterium]|nr:glycosyltransferase family 4 protein [Chloroflexota bacterium]